MDGNLTAGKPPLYPLFLAAAQLLFGAGSPAVFVLQALLGAAVPVVVYLWGRRLMEEGPARLAGILAAVDPFLIYYTNRYLTEVLFTALLVPALWAASHALSPTARVRTALTAGLAWGLASLCRAPAFLFPFLAAASHVALKPGRPAGRRAGVLVLGLVCALSPWAIRNWNLTGRLVLTTTHSGWTFWEGLNPDFQTQEGIRRWQEAMEAERAGLARQGYGEAEVDRHFWKKSVRHIRERPLAFAGLTGRKFLKFWRPVPYFPYSGAQKAVSFAYFAPLLLLSAVGLAAVLKKAEWRVLLGFLLYFSLIHSLFWTQIRYRVPLHPFLALLAAKGVGRYLKR